MGDDGKTYVFTVRTNPYSMLPSVDFFVDVTMLKDHTAEKINKIKTVYSDMGATDMVAHIENIERALRMMHMRYKLNVDMNSRMYCIHVEDSIDSDTLDAYLASQLRLGQLRKFLDSAKI